MINNQSELELQFCIGHYNGTMRMQIFFDNIQVFDFADIKTESLTVKHRMTLPCCMKILLSDKDLTVDTKIDSDGKIIADKFIKLEKILVDRIDPGIEYMKSIALDTGENKLNVLYWGFNGTVELAFDATNSFIWHLSQKIHKDKDYLIIKDKF